MTINYPKTVAFAFNPIIVEVADVSELVTIVIEGGLTITREPIYGVTRFDLQAIARSLFDRKRFPSSLQDASEQDYMLYKELVFTVWVGNTNHETKFINVIWGALQIGEIYSQSKTLTWFKNSPFSIPVFLEGDKQALIRYDNNKYEDWKTIFEGKNNIKTGLPDASNKVVIRINAGDEGGVFDYTFDYTFRSISKNTIIIRLNVNECTDGIYLRWINKHGEYCYYLFSTGIESNEVRNGGINLIEFIRTVGFVSGYNPGTDHTQSKEGQKSVKLFVPLVDADTYKFLTSLVESVVVDMFMGYNDNKDPLWMGVNIAPGTFARDNSPLQDFECNLILPKTFTQEL